MMDSRMQKLAMEQMRRMSPEQLEQLRSQMNNISPAALERVQRQMANMSPEQMEQVEQRLKTTDPSSLPSVSSTIQARQAHAYKASLELKNAGNVLYKSENYMAAVEKYERAKSNMSLFADKESSDLVATCCLNMANCYLKLEMYAQCVIECTEVLRESPINVKALYRRGQAYMHQKKNKQALADLKKTLGLTTHSSQEKALVQQKIDFVKQQIKEQDCEISEVEEIEEIPVNQEREGRSMDSSADDGSAWRKSAEAVSRMTDDEIRRLNKQTGMDISPDMVRSAQAAMKEMDSETLSQMASLAEKLNVSDQKDKPVPPFAHPTIKPDNIQMVREMCEKHPEIVKEQAQKLSQMSQEELERLAQRGGSFDGIKLTPEMARQAAEFMTRMDDEEVKKLPTAMRAQSSNPTHASEGTSSSAQSQPSPQMCATPAMMAAMSEAMQNISPEQTASMARMAGNIDTSSMSGDVFSNPDFLKLLPSMIQSMDEETIMSMMSASGMQRNESETRAMVRRIKQMSPGQLEALMKTVSYGQKGVQAMNKAKEWLKSRTALICAIVVIIIGIVLRLLGLM